MRCPTCRADNASDRRQCAQCGAALAPPEPQRRQLTVMFCDLVGSTELANRLDPEDLGPVIREFQQTVARVAARFDGYLARYMGDGALVYFGYPRAHEDDAARAIAAGLATVEAVAAMASATALAPGQPLGVRVGIATGLVVVGSTGETDVEDSLVLGTAPNLAARLQSLALPGTVMVGPTTRELAGGQYTYVDAGPQELKGFAQPVRAWRVSGATDSASRFEAMHRRRLTPLVGREPELAVLQECWDRARSGPGRVAVLRGEAGIGKSRIAQTLAERIDPRSPTLVFQCSPVHTNSALHPFIRQLEVTARLDRGDPPEQRRARLAAWLAEEGAVAADAAALIASLISPAGAPAQTTPMDPLQQKERTLAALLARLRALAARHGLLVLFEDTQWIDPTSRELLDLMARTLGDAHVLLVITTREGPPVALAQDARVLALERLPQDAARKLVRGMTERRRLPAPVMDAIVAKADGVPLFLEELTRTAQSARGPDDAVAAIEPRRLDIPATLKDSLMARLDQLGSARELAQVAAVLGREFAPGTVAAMASMSVAALDEALSRLLAADIIHAAPSGTPGFVFKHALVQEAAYASLVRARRQDLHRRAATTLEADPAGVATVEPEIVAYHYTQAAEPMRAAHYWAAAARRALDAAGNLETLAHAEKGLQVLATAPDGRERDTLAMNLEVLRGAAHRAVSGFASSEAERSFLRARELCEALGDERSVIDIRRGLFSCYYARGAIGEAREQGESVASAGQRLGDRSATMLGHWMIGCATFWQGEFATARRELEQAYALYDPSEQRAKTLALQIDPGVNALCHMSWLLWILGDPGAAIRTAAQAIATARELEQPFAVAMGLFFASTTHACCGDAEAAGAYRDELEAVTARHGLGYLGICARVLKAQALIAANDPQAGLAQIDLAFREFRAQEAGVGMPWVLAIAAQGYARLGAVERGLDCVARGLAAAQRNGERHWQAELHRLEGELRLLGQAPDEARAGACYRAALACARQQGARSLELRAALSLARMRATTEDLVRSLAALCDVYPGEPLTADLRLAHALLDERRAGARMS